MATIRTRRTKTGEQRQYVEIRLSGHPVIRKTIRGTRTQAREWARKTEALLTTGQYDPEPEKSRTLKEAADLYVADFMRDRVTTRETRKERVAHLEHWVEELGGLPLEKVDHLAVNRIKRELARTRAASTVNHYLGALSAVFEVAIRELGWCETNPVRRVSRMSPPKKRVRFLSEDERDDLMRACRESPEARLLGLVLCALSSGARQGELLALQWGDLSLDGDVARGILRRTKSRRTRAVTFPGEATAWLRGRSGVRHISGYVFAAGRTRAGRPPKFMQAAWHEALRVADIERDAEKDHAVRPEVPLEDCGFHFHDLRHTFASYLAMSGATLLEIADRLGHSSVDLVQRYAHLSPEHSEGVTLRMAEKFLR